MTAIETYVCTGRQTHVCHAVVPPSMTFLHLLEQAGVQFHLHVLTSGQCALLWGRGIFIWRTCIVWMLNRIYCCTFLNPVIDSCVTGLFCLVTTCIFLPNHVRISRQLGFQLTQYWEVVWIVVSTATKLLTLHIHLWGEEDFDHYLHVQNSVY